MDLISNVAGGDVGGAAGAAALETVEEFGCAALSKMSCNRFTFGKCKWGPSCIPKDDMDITSYAICAQAPNQWMCGPASGVSMAAGGKGCKWSTGTCSEAE
jgi:hypothetical protein